MNINLENTSENASFTPDLIAEATIELDIPKMGDYTVSLINQALEVVRHDPREFRFMFDISSFEMDVMVVNQYHCVAPSMLETNEILPESGWEKGGKAYYRAYKTAQLILSKSKSFTKTSSRKFINHHAI